VRNIQALASQYTIFVPDLPGYGSSDTPISPSLESLLELTVVTLNHLVGATTRIGIVGFSFGALVAAHLAAQRKEVFGLVLLGPAGHGGPRRPNGDLHDWRGVARAGDAASLKAVMRHNLATHMLHDPASIDSLATEVHSGACLQTRFHSKTLSRAGGLREALDKCNFPLILAWGEHDVTAEPEALSQQLSEARRSCSTSIVARAGHWVQYEQAGLVNQLVLDGLTRCEPTAGEVGMARYDAEQC
jgi:pimeloyl-ACP methyl ester carboxylesterase